MLFAALAAVMALVSCNKEDQELPQEKVTKTVTFNAVVPQTKALFSTPDGANYPVRWTENDKKVDLLVNYNYNNKVQPDITRSDDNKSITFSADIETGGNAYTFVAVSPANSVISSNNTDKRFGAVIPTAQEPIATSPDENAIILYAKSDNFNAFQSSVDMDFKHVTAYLHVQFKNYATTLDGATVTSVSVTSTKDIAGRFFIYLENGADATVVKNSPSSTIVATTSSIDDVWFALAPVDLSNEILEFVVNTDKGTVTKKIQCPASAVLGSGKIAKFPISLSGSTIETPVQYNLVTDANQLHVGDRVIIVAANSDLALSTTQNANNRGTAGITKGDGVILDPSDAVEVIELEDGYKPGEYALKATKEEGYLYAPGGSGNYMRTAATLDKLGSWYITISASEANGANEPDPSGTTANVARIYAGASDHGLLRYNYNSGNSIFSAYTLSTSTSYVHLYRFNKAADDSTPRFVARMPETETSSTAKNDIEVYVLGNSAWEASVTGEGASLSETSGTGNKILTLTIPENTSTSETRTYTVTVTTKADVEIKSYVLTLTQAKAVNTSGDPEKVYSFTLSQSDNNKGSNGSYAGNCNVTINGVEWNVTGVSNSSTYDGWRLGGKSLNKVDRAMYSKTAIAADVTKVIVKHNAKNITINSFTLTVHRSAADAATGDNAVATLSGEVSTSTPTVFQKEGSTSWAGCFYRLTYNVTNNSTSSNKYVQFGGLEIWGYPVD